MSQRNSCHIFCRIFAIAVFVCFSLGIGHVTQANPQKDQAIFVLAAKNGKGKHIDIDLSRQRLTIFEDGKMLNTYVISTGKASMRTPTGNFSVQSKVPRAWSAEYGLFMPYWMAVVPSGAVGIHELPEWPSGYKEGANHLGIPVSHGCIRLGVGPAKRVYDWADIGTPVIIHN